MSSTSTYHVCKTFRDGCVKDDSSSLSTQSYYPISDCTEPAGQVQGPECNPFSGTWTDKFGKTCQDYKDKKWCTLTGDYGNGWDQKWGTFRQSIQ